MRILQLGKFYPIRGGVEKVMWNLTKGLSGQGIPCDMLCARLKEEKTEHVRVNKDGEMFCVKALAKVAATMISPEMVLWLRKRASAYDIIHVHHPDPMAALALRLSGFRGKVILHWHSDILSQRALLALYRPLQSWLVRRADAIIGTTPVYLQESAALREVQDKCVAVPIGIPELVVDKASAEAFRQRYPGKVILLSVGRLVPYKGYPVLIEALKQLPEEYHLVIGGMGPLENALKAQVADAGLERRVSFLGYLPEEDLPAYFGACDIFVLSSCMKTEAFGIVQVEAMSCGKPVVATKIPGSGVSWVNADGVSGKNALPDNPSSLARAILEVGGNREEYGRGARERYLRLFTEDQMIKSIIGIYEKFL